MNFLIHTPVSVYGKMMEVLKSNLDDIEESVGDNISFCSPHDLCDENEEEGWMSQLERMNKIPEIMLTPAPDFASIVDKNRAEIFSDFAFEYVKKHPVRQELSMLEDPEGIFYPISVIPLVMIYNSETVDENDLTHSWADMFNEKYKVILPFRDKPMTRATGAFLLKNYPDKFPEFEKRVCYDGYPIDGMKAVLSGEYDMSMTIYPFATMGESRGVKINSTKEGFILFPQVITWKKGVEASVAAVTNHLVATDFQKFLSEQGIWPVNPNTELPKSMQFDGCLKNWKGWDNYIKEVDAFDHFKI